MAQSSIPTTTGGVGVTSRPRRRSSRSNVSRLAEIPSFADSQRAGRLHQKQRVRAIDVNDPFADGAK
jgi:hypothetical protein